MNQNQLRNDTEPRSVDQQQACSPLRYTVISQNLANNCPDIVAPILGPGMFEPPVRWVKKGGDILLEAFRHPLGGVEVPFAPDAHDEAANASGSDTRTQDINMIKKPIERCLQPACYVAGDAVEICDHSEAHGDKGAVLWTQDDGLLMVELEGGACWPVTADELKPHNVQDDPRENVQ